MDILNFISWIRGGRVVSSVDPDRTLIPVGLKDGRRDDDYLAGAISVTDFITQVGDTVRPYKVFTALLTQSGGDGPQTGFGDESFVLGVTYTITANPNNYDLTIYGAPNNNVGTSFISTGYYNLPYDSSLTFLYNTGAPVATVLENTIGNIWFSYDSVGFYYCYATNDFPYNKTVSFVTATNSIDTETIWLQNQVDYIQLSVANSLGTWVDGLLESTPIEIRVYN